MRIEERERRAFYDFLRAQIATTFFKTTIDKAQCIITTTNGEQFTSELSLDSTQQNKINKERRTFARAYRQLKNNCGYWALYAYNEI